MLSKRMFKTEPEVVAPTCFQASTSEETTLLWHNRYGHLNFKGQRLFSQKDMVKGLPRVEEPTKVCDDCIIGKQHRDSFP